MCGGGQQDTFEKGGVIGGELIGGDGILQVCGCF